MRLKIFILAAVVFLFAACAPKPALKCNLHVIEEMSARRIYLPDKNANELDAYLKKSKDWQLIPKTNNKLNHEAAYKAAKSGRAVLASYPAGKRSGHIVVIHGKKKPAWSNSWRAAVPYTSGSRNGEKVKIKPLSYQFSKDKEPAINYFIYVRK